MGIWRKIHDTNGDRYSLFEGSGPASGCYAIALEREYDENEPDRRLTLTSGRNTGSDGEIWRDEMLALDPDAFLETCKA